MRYAIVTGANGFVGFAVTKELLNNNYSVICLIRPESVTTFTEKTKSLKNSDNIHIVQTNLTDIELIAERINEYNLTNQWDVLYHFAWEGSAGPRRADFDIQQNNIIITKSMVKLCSLINCKRFVGAGSIMEDEVMSMVYSNNVASTPNYIYSAAKLQAHLISSIVARQEGIEFIWGKITNFYGVGDSTNRFINSTLKKMLNNEDCSFSKADQLYDFLYIDDASRAFRLLGEKGVTGKTYTLGSSNATELKKYILCLAKVTNTKSKIVFGEYNSGVCYLDAKCYDSSLLSSDTGFVAQIPFEEGVKKAIEHINILE